MRRSEDGHEEIERVLAGLRAVKAPAGMEARVLQRMQAAADGQGTVVRAGWNWLAAAAVMAMVLLVLAGVGGMRWRQRGAAVVVTRARVAAGAADLEGRKVGGGTESAESAGLPGMPAPEVKRGEDRDGARGRAARAGVATGEGTGTLGEEARREEMVAVEEMRAPSLVAPALPLTKEERLLQRAAERGGVEEMAALNAEEREKEGAASRAEFRKFFGPARSEVGELDGKRQGDDSATN